MEWGFSLFPIPFIRLKAIIFYATHVGNTNFLDIQKREQITSFLYTKIKSEKDDPEKNG
jgi:hypothetical protein